MNISLFAYKKLSVIIMIGFFSLAAQQVYAQVGWVYTGTYLNSDDPYTTQFSINYPYPTPLPLYVEGSAKYNNLHFLNTNDIAYILCYGNVNYTPSIDGAYIAMHGNSEPTNGGALEFASASYGGPSPNFVFSDYDAGTTTTNTLMKLSGTGDLEIPKNLTVGAVLYGNSAVCRQNATIGDFNAYGIEYFYREVYAYMDCGVQGDIYANLFGSISDKQFKKNIEPLNNNTRKQLFKLTPYQYYFNQEAFPEKHFDGKLHFGFLAQEVQEVYPSLVNVCDTEGHLSINYTEFIPLILQTLKEENVVLTDLKQQITTFKTSLNATRQNDLNTSIPNVYGKYTLSESIYDNNAGAIKINYKTDDDKAYIGIYNLSGKQIMNIAAPANNEQVVIDKSTLASGTYFYSLVANSTLIDTKKMIVE